MPKLATSLPLSLSAPSPGTPLYRWFYEELRSAILERRIAPGARLPATRDLAREYKLSRATVVAAFEQLKSEGYVEGKVGAGTYVSQVLPEELLHVARAGTGAGMGPRRVRWSSYARRLALFRGGGEPRITRAFRANQAALDAFPTTLWAQVAARRLRRASTKLLAGGEARGYRPLRQAVAEYLNASRGVKCSADQVLIISGVQEALERAAHLLLDPGDPVWVEEPGYPGAAIVFAAVGAKVHPVPVNAEGLDLEYGRRRWRHAKLVYVTPAHQFPLGVTMSLRRRLALLEWARRSQTLIFEDDYDSEYRYSGRPIPALQGLDRAGVVIFAGSFMKFSFPRSGSAIWWFLLQWWIALARLNRSACVTLLCSTKPYSATSSPKDISRAISGACANSMPNAWVCCWNRPAPGCQACWKFPASKPDCRWWAGWRRGSARMTLQKKRSSARSK